MKVSKEEFVKRVLEKGLIRVLSDSGLLEEIRTVTDADAITWFRFINEIGLVLVVREKLAKFTDSKPH